MIRNTSLSASTTTHQRSRRVQVRSGVGDHHQPKGLSPEGVYNDYDFENVIVACGSGVYNNVDNDDDKKKSKQKSRFLITRWFNHRCLSLFLQKHEVFLDHPGVISSSNRRRGVSLAGIICIILFTFAASCALKTTISVVDMDSRRRTFLSTKNFTVIGASMINPPMYLANQHHPGMMKMVVHGPPTATKKLKKKALVPNYGDLDISFGEDSDGPKSRRHNDETPKGRVIMINEIGEMNLAASDSKKHKKKSGNEEESNERETESEEKSESEEEEKESYGARNYYYAYDDDQIRNTYTQWDDDNIQNEKTCRRTSWHRDLLIDCNKLHEFDLQTRFVVDDTHFVGHGGFREVFLSDEENVVFKWYGYDGHFHLVDFEEMRVDALVSEKLSPFKSKVVDIYGFCGTGVINEAMVHGDLAKLVINTVDPEEKNENNNKEDNGEGPLLVYNDLTGTQKIQLALEMAEALAVVHGYGGGVMVHDDIKPDNFLLTKGSKTDNYGVKLNDFNRAEVMLYNEDDQEYCRFVNDDGPGPVSSN